MHDPGLWAQMLHPDDRDDAIETYLRGRELGEPFVYEYRLVARDGRVLWFRDSAIVLADADGRPALIQGVMLDITERKAAEEQIAYLAYHDKLTGLPNRAMFDELLELSLARAQRNGLGVAVISVDLDDFKLVNDSLGHETGDELIAVLAERVREATRDTDLVARPGGDEFLVLLADLDMTPPVPGGQDGGSIAAEAVAVRIQEAMRAPFEIAGTELYLTASQGIGVYPHDADGAVTLLKNAETAMFESKKIGPGGFIVHTRTSGDSMTRLSMSTRLRKAVEHEAVDAALPAADRAGVGPDVRRRSPDPVARAERRAGAAGRVHPARRGDGADRGDRRLGGRRDLPSGRAVASRGPASSRWASTSRRGSSGSPTSSTSWSRRS